MDPRRAGVGERPRLGDGVVAVDGLAVEVALVRRTQRPPRRSIAGIQVHQRSLRRRSARRSWPGCGRPLAARLLGVELVAHTLPALDRGDHRAAVVAGGDRVGRRRRPRTSGRSTPTPDRAARRAAASAASTSSTFHCICGRFTPSGSRRDVPGRTPRPGHAGRLLRALVQHLHADADAEERAVAERPPRRRRRRARRRASASMQRPKAPTPGSTTPAASAIRPGSAVSRASAPTCSSAFWAERRLPMP